MACICYAQSATFVETLLLCSEKAADIARLIRTQCSLFSTLIQQKSHSEANARFDVDVMTLADVLIQQSIRYDIEKQFPGFAVSVYGEEGSAFRNASGESIQLTIPQSVDELERILSQVLEGQQSLVHDLAELILSPLSHFRTHAAVREHFPLEVHPAELELAQLAIWIDPIDATAEYVQGTPCDTSCYERSTTLLEPGSSSSVVRYSIPGTLANITVLIGLFSRSSGLPLLGVINQPFYPREETNIGGSESYGRLFWNSYLAGPSSNCIPSLPPTTKCFPDWSLQRLSSSIELQSDVRQLRVACSWSDFASLECIFKDWNLPSKLVIFSSPGAGFKLLCLILCQVDIYLVLKPNTYFWDTCGPHAILRAQGGGILRLKPVLAYARQHLTQSLTEVPELDASILHEFEIHYIAKPSEYTDLSCCCNLDGFLAYRDSRIACQFLLYLARTIDL